MKSLDFIDSKSMSDGQEEQMMSNRKKKSVFSCSNRTTCLHSPVVL